MTFELVKKCVELIFYSRIFFSSENELIMHIHTHFKYIGIAQNCEILYLIFVVNFYITIFNVKFNFNAYLVKSQSG